MKAWASIISVGMFLAAIIPISGLVAEPGDPVMAGMTSPVVDEKLRLDKATMDQGPGPIRLEIPADLKQVVPLPPGLTATGPTQTQRTPVLMMHAFDCDNSWMAAAMTRALDVTADAYPPDEVAIVQFMGNWTGPFGFLEEQGCSRDPGLGPMNTYPPWLPDDMIYSSPQSPYGAYNGSDNLYQAFSCPGGPTDLCMISSLTIDTPWWQLLPVRAQCSWQDWSDSGPTTLVDQALTTRLGMPASFSLTLTADYTAATESGSFTLDIEALEDRPDLDYADMALNIFVVDDYDVLHFENSTIDPACTQTPYQIQHSIRYQMVEWPAVWSLGSGPVGKGDLFAGVSSGFARGDVVNPIPWNEPALGVVAILQHEGEVLQATYISPGDVRPDLSVRAVDIALSPSSPVSGDLVWVNATIRNLGGTGVVTEVTLFDGDPDLGGSQLAIQPIFVAANGSAVASFGWDSTGAPGDHNLVIGLDRSDVIDETNENNNKASRDIFIAGLDDASICGVSFIPGPAPVVGSNTILADICNPGANPINSSFPVRLTVDQLTSPAPLVIFADDFDGNQQGLPTWSATGLIDGAGVADPAGLEPTNIGYIGERNWDAVGGYGNNWNEILTLNDIDLTPPGLVSAQLSFDYFFDTEATYDFAYVNCGGGPDERSWDGVAGGWIGDIIDLSPFLGSTINCAFRLISDGTWSDEDGFYNGYGLAIDDVLIEAFLGGAGTVCSVETLVGPLAPGEMTQEGFPCVLPAPATYSVSVETGYLGWATWFGPGLCVGVTDDICLNNRFLDTYSIADTGVAPPSNLANVGVGANVDLVWNLSADDGAGANDVVGYAILRAPIWTGPYAGIGNVSAGIGSFADVGAGPGPNLWYRVVAIDMVGDRGASGEVSKFDFPPEVVNLRANAQSGYLEIPQGTPNITIQGAILDDTSLVEPITGPLGAEICDWDHASGPWVDPGYGNCLALSSGDGQWDSTAEVMANVIWDTSGWGLGANHTFCVRAFDGAGWNDTDMCAEPATNTITVAIPGDPPIACMDPVYQTGPAPFAATLDGSCSSDAQGPIVNWTWNSGAGGPWYGAVVNPLIPIAWNFTVCLTVMDGSGQTDSTCGILNTTQYSFPLLVTTGPLSSWNIISVPMANLPPTDVRVLYDDTIWGDGGELVDGFWYWTGSSWVSHFDARPAYLNDVIIVAAATGGVVFANVSSSTGDGVITVAMVGGVDFGVAGAGSVTVIGPGWMLLGYLASTPQPVDDLLGQGITEVWVSDGGAPFGLRQVQAGQSIGPGQGLWLLTTTAQGVGF